MGADTQQSMAYVSSRPVWVLPVAVGAAALLLLLSLFVFSHTPSSPEYRPVLPSAFTVHLESGSPEHPGSRVTMIDADAQRYFSKLTLDGATSFEFYDRGTDSCFVGTETSCSRTECINVPDASLIPLRFAGAAACPAGVAATACDHFTDPGDPTDRWVFDRDSHTWVALASDDMALLVTRFDAEPPTLPELPAECFV